MNDDAAKANCWKCELAVEWHDCHWCPAIVQRQSVELRRGVSCRTHSVRRINLIKPMKTKSIFSRHQNGGFTLVELLTVIAIIAILAALLLPVISRAITQARITRAKTEEQALVNAIEAYDSAYGRYPVSTNVQALASSSGGDFTYGCTLLNPNSPTASIFTIVDPSSPTSPVMTNADVIAILMNMTAFPNGVPTVNANYVKNPRQTVFLNATLSGYNPVNGGTPLPGVDNAGVYRDPWGNPYIISIDLNYDNQCSDSLYASQKVSQVSNNSQTGYNGLFNTNSANPNTDSFAFHGPVMVWSAGPDGKVNAAVNSNTAENKDNVLSWK